MFCPSMIVLVAFLLWTISSSFDFAASSGSAWLAVLDRFAQKGVDYLAISGGDGTVRDVLTGGAEIFGDDWPPLIVLPKGKPAVLINSQTLGTGVPSLSIDNAWKAPPGHITTAVPVEICGGGRYAAYLHPFF